MFFVYLFDGFYLCIIFINVEKKKKTISTRLTKENPKQRPSIPPMFAIRVATDITCATISEKWKSESGKVKVKVKVGDKKSFLLVMKFKNMVTMC